MSDVPHRSPDEASHERMRACGVSIVRALAAAGHEALFAGGCVRDQIMGQTPKDFDVATSATPDEVIALFDRTVAVGAAFGVVRVLVEDMEFEVATFRTEGGYSDGRRPDDVTWASAHEDVQRRDFTVNGLLFDPLQGEGVVIDHVGGLVDLEARVLRAIGEPSERFEEDRLRLLRAIRFAARLNFSIEEGTWAALVEHGSAIVAMSAERIRDELERMWTQSAPGPAFEMLARSGMWIHVLPEVTDPTRAIGRFADTGPLEARVGWAALMADLDPETGAAVARRFKLSNSAVRHISAALAALGSLRGYERLSVAERKRILRTDEGRTSVEVASLARGAEQFPSAALEAASEDLNRWTQEDLFPAPLLNGQDLIEAGHTPGPGFQEALSRVEDALLEGATLDREEALDLAVSQLVKP